MNTLLRSFQSFHPACTITRFSRLHCSESFRTPTVSNPKSQSLASKSNAGADQTVITSSASSSSEIVHDPRYFQDVNIIPRTRHRVPDPHANNLAVQQFFDPKGASAPTPAGRSWRASELRLKSFDDLHKLWFVLLKERNVLLSERQWCITNGRYWRGGGPKMWKVKKSMSRIKCVMGERIRAYNEARKKFQAMEKETETQKDARNMRR